MELSHRKVFPPYKELGYQVSYRLMQTNISLDRCTWYVIQGAAGYTQGTLKKGWAGDRLMEALFTEVWTEGWWDVQLQGKPRGGSWRRSTVGQQLPKRSHMRLMSELQWGRVSRCPYILYTPIHQSSSAFTFLAKSLFFGWVQQKNKRSKECG